jgi:phosphoribosylamine---glycine ligase
VNTVLIVGSGAREHALVWALRRSPLVGHILVAPGNAGTGQDAQNVPCVATDIDGLCDVVREYDVDLTVIGPEAPLALGLADRLRAEGRRVVGPDRAAARLEWSKSFAKALMVRHGIPTAAYAAFTAPGPALAYLDRHPEALVVKADGLAAGKGVVVCATPHEARETVREIFATHRFGDAASTVVLEERLQGSELSLMALVDGERAVALPVARDHKRLLDGDRGPNTGGMGAVTPVPGIDDTAIENLLNCTVRPAVAALAAAGTPYRGVLFAGLMLTADGPRVLEYNCRFGDPETQVVLPCLQEDLYPWLEAVADGTLPHRPIRSAGAAVGIVLAAPGYPDSPRLGTPIVGLDQVRPDTLIFHAGTSRNTAGDVVTAGGRVLTGVARGATVEEARRHTDVLPIRFEGMQRRRDIGRPAPAGDLPRIAVLASGDGSNLQALLDATASGALPAQIALVVSHRIGAGALSRAQAAGVPAYTLPLAGRRDSAARELLEAQLLGLLRSYRIDLTVLAGWMLILSESFLEQCSFPIVNVHPALLPMSGAPLPDPSFPVLRGAHAVRDALRLGLDTTGVSVHIVTGDVDAGLVLLREAVSIEPGDDDKTLHRRLKAVEHRLLPRAVASLLSSISTGGAHAGNGIATHLADTRDVVRI